MKITILCAMLFLTGCAGSSPQRIESVQTAAERGDGDIESGIYNNEQNENLAVTVKTLQAEIFEQNQKVMRLEQEIQSEKLKNQALTHEQNVLRARAQVRERRNPASIKGWTPSGDPVLEQK